jgi:DNA uptake protein ComE-like DNA-binding protein
VISYRDRHKGFSSIDDLGDVPGMPSEFLLNVKKKLTL